MQMEIKTISLSDAADLITSFSQFQIIIICPCRLMRLLMLDSTYGICLFCIILYITDLYMCLLLWEVSLIASDNYTIVYRGRNRSSQVTITLLYIVGGIAHRK